MGALRGRLLQPVHRSPFLQALMQYEPLYCRLFSRLTGLTECDAKQRWVPRQEGRGREELEEALVRFAWFRALLL